MSNQHYVLTVEGKERVIHNILENTKRRLYAYYYNHKIIITVSISIQKIVCISPAGNILLLLELRGEEMAPFSICIEKCVVVILENYSQTIKN